MVGNGVAGWIKISPLIGTRTAKLTVSAAVVTFAAVMAWRSVQVEAQVLPAVSKELLTTNVAACSDAEIHSPKATLIKEFALFILNLQNILIRPFLPTCAHFRWRSARPIPVFW